MIYIKYLLLILKLPPKDLELPHLPSQTEACTPEVNPVWFVCMLLIRQPLTNSYLSPGYS